MIILFLGFSTTPKRVSQRECSRKVITFFYLFFFAEITFHSFLYCNFYYCVVYNRSYCIVSPLFSIVLFPRIFFFFLQPKKFWLEKKKKMVFSLFWLACFFFCIFLTHREKNWSFLFYFGFFPFVAILWDTHRERWSFLYYIQSDNNLQSFK